MNSLDQLPPDLWEDGAPQSPFFRLHEQLRGMFMETEKSLLAGEKPNWEACWRRQALLLKDIRFTTQSPYTQGIWFKILLFSNLSSAQLRTYLDWRTRWQKGLAGHPVPKSLLQLYAMEIILRIRKESEEEAIEKMAALTHVPISDETLGALHALEGLLQDFFLTLSPRAREKLLERISLSCGSDPADPGAKILSQPEKSTDEAIFLTLLSYASRDMEPLRENERAVRLVGGIWRSLHRLQAAKAKGKQPDRFWGSYRSRRYNLFAEFPFHQLASQSTCEETIPIRSDCCWQLKAGSWRRVSLQPNILKLTGLVRDIFLAVCRSLDVHNRKVDEDRERKIPVKIVKALQEALALEKQKEAARIDVSRLEHIRKLAKETQEALCIENLSPDDLPSAVSAAEIEKTQPALSAAPTADAIALTQQEADLLRLTLAAPSPVHFVSHGSEPLSLIVDRVNEKLLPVLGDIALSLTGNEIHLQSDYVGEIKKLLDHYPNQK